MQDVLTKSPSLTPASSVIGSDSISSATTISPLPSFPSLQGTGSQASPQASGLCNFAPASVHSPSTILSQKPQQQLVNLSGIVNYVQQQLQQQQQQMHLTPLQQGQSELHQSTQQHQLVIEAEPTIQSEYLLITIRYGYGFDHIKSIKSFVSGRYGFCPEIQQHFVCY